MFEVKPLSKLPGHHFFGYYDINTWDNSLRYHLSLETNFHEHRPTPDDVASVGLIDSHTGEFIPYAKTSAFNLQQGSMMHWINAGSGEEFTFNDWQDGVVVSRAVNKDTRKIRTIQGAIAAISPSGPVAIGLNYARMSHCRPVVGYANNMDTKEITDTPEDDGLFLIDLKSGESRLIMSIAHVIRESQCDDVIGKRAWFNHVVFNTNGSRIMFFCRARGGNKRYDSLWTINPDGSDLKCQIPFGNWVSHFDWRDPKRILISTDVMGEGGFVEFTDSKGDFKPFGRGILPRDGHASFSPDRRWLLSDLHSRNEALGSFYDLMLYDIDKNIKISLGKFPHDDQFTGDTRCDLHPRWSPDGRLVTFDSVHERSRQIYIIDVGEIVS